MQLPPAISVAFVRAQQLVRLHWKTASLPVLVSLMLIIWVVPRTHSWLQQQFVPPAAQANSVPTSPVSQPTETDPILSDASARLDIQTKSVAATNTALQDLSTKLKSSMTEIARLSALLQQELQTQRASSQPVSATFDALPVSGPPTIPVASLYQSLAPKSGTQVITKKSITTLLVHLNSAPLSQLEQLPGIGSSYAERIIAYRSSHGGFKNIEELRSVKGIGEARLKKIRPHIAL